MPHSYTNRLQSTAVIGALLALVATIVVLIAIAHAFAVSSPVCHGVSPGDVRTGDSAGTLTGYRLP